jgi:hypothetical protein
MIALATTDEAVKIAGLEIPHSYAEYAARTVVLLVFAQCCTHLLVLVAMAREKKNSTQLMPLTFQQMAGDRSGSFSKVDALSAQCVSGSGRPVPRSNLNISIVAALATKCPAFRSLEQSIAAKLGRAAY